MEQFKKFEAMATLANIKYATLLFSKSTTQFKTFQRKTQRNYSNHSKLAYWYTDYITFLKHFDNRVDEHASFQSSMQQEQQPQEQLRHTQQQ